MKNKSPPACFGHILWLLKEQQYLKTYRALIITLFLCANFAGYQRLTISFTNWNTAKIDYKFVIVRFISTASSGSFLYWIDFLVHVSPPSHPVALLDSRNADLISKKPFTLLSDTSTLLPLPSLTEVIYNFCTSLIHPPHDKMSTREPLKENW